MTCEKPTVKTVGFSYVFEEFFDGYRYFLWLRLAILYYIWYSYPVIV